MRFPTHAQAKVTHVRGPGMPLLRVVLLESLSAPDQIRFQVGLSPEAQAFLAAPVAESEWVPLEVVLEVERAYMAITDRDPFSTHGILLAQRLMDGRLEGLLLGWMGPRAFLRILPHTWGRFNRGGVLHLDQLGEREATLSLWADFPTSTFVARIVPAFAGEALRRMGASEAEVSYEGPGPEEPAWRHRYRVRWKA